MRIYIASLADYNDGIHFGKWFDINDYDFAFELEDAISAMLRKSPAFLATGHTEQEAIEGKVNPVDYVEYAIHDTEECPEYLRGEYTPIADFFEWREATEGMDEDTLEAFKEWLDDDSTNTPNNIDKFNEEYQGKFHRPGDFAEYWLDEMGHLQNIPVDIRNHIDFEAYEDCELFIGDFWKSEHGHVFWRA